MIDLHTVLSADRSLDTPICRDGNVLYRLNDFKDGVATLTAAFARQSARRYALSIEDSFYFAQALFALLACEKTPLILASAAPDYIASLADSYDVLLTERDVSALLDDRIPGVLITPVIPSSGAEAAASTGQAMARIAPDALLTLYTSGSSQVPKAVHKTLAQFNAEVHTLQMQWGDAIGDAIVLSGVPHHHIYGLLFSVLWPLAAGRPFSRTLCLTPQALQTQLSQSGAAVVVSTPAQLSRWPSIEGFAALTPQPLIFFSSGGPLSFAAAIDYTSTFGAAPIEVYGSTETGGIGWRRQDLGDAWTVVPGAQIRAALDGALEVRSAHLGHDDWHRTDDAVTIDDAGRFRLQGRLDRVLKIHGKRLSLPEIEARLASHEYVAQSAVVLLEPRSHERTGAIVVLTEAGNAALMTQGRVRMAKILRRHLAAYFDLAVLPRYWRFRFALPFDARGKLPAAALAAVFATPDDGPEIMAEAHEGEHRRYELRVPPTLLHFAGHFPGLPILPGVVQIDWAIRLAAIHLPQIRRVASIDKLKFTAPVGPAALLILDMKHDSARRRMQFSYRLGERECASGVIVYRDDI